MPNPSEKMLEHAKIPGISTAVVSGGKVVSHAVGVTNILNPQPVTDTTVFEAASLSKPVFAYIVLKMVERGLFSRPGEKPEDGLDRPLHEIFDFEYDLALMSTLPDNNKEKAENGIIYLSEDGQYVVRDPKGVVQEGALNTKEIDLSQLELNLRNSDLKSAILKVTSNAGHTHGFGPPHLRDHPNYNLLTVRMILSHQAGLPNWFEGGPQKYVAPVGTQFDYSGEAFFFLNEVLEKVSGKNFHQLSQELFHSKDLQMTHSSFIPHADNSPEGNNRAWGHRMDQSVDESLHCEPRNEEKPKPIPASSLYTTAEDYGKFMNACMNNSFIRQHMFNPQVALVGKDAKASKAGVTDDTLSHLHWGLGIGIQTNPDGGKIAFHWGDNGTFRGFTAMDLQTNKGVVCLTNSENGPLMFRQVAEPVVGDLTPVSQWLTHREQLNLNTTDMYRRVIAVEKKSSVEANTSPSNVDSFSPK